MNSELLNWFQQLALFSVAFTVPSQGLLGQLAIGWVLCPGRHTLTRIYQMAEPARERAHDAYHRFFRRGAWTMDELWMILARRLILQFYSQGRIVLDLDDTTFHKTGRCIQDAAWWRDAVRSTGQKLVHCFGLNVVVLTLRVQPAWGGQPLGLPILMRLHRKKGVGLLDLAQEMIQVVSRWFPTRDFLLCADGFYASLAGRHLPRTHIISRMRRDAALYKAAPHMAARKRGRPRKKGTRLPCPTQLAATTRRWKRVRIQMRATFQTRLVSVHDLLWYGVCGKQLVRLVICRDPKGKEPDDFFVCTDLLVSGSQIISFYAGRWCIEETFKNVKQHLGAQDPQSWKHRGPERIAAFSFWLYSLCWLWFLTTQNQRACWLVRPWYACKAYPSFADVLATLRRALWRQRLFPTSKIQSLSRKNIAPLIDALAYAA
jgi:hypothetical protein